MDNLPPSGFQFVGDDYGPVDFPSSLQSDMQAGMSFAGGGPVFPQNQRGSSYGMSPFHMNYSQQTSMPSMSSLPSSSFRSRFSEYASEQSPHIPMPIPSSASGMISDRLPSFSTIVSSSGGSSSDIGKSSQALYSSISGQQHAFQPSGSRSHQTHFDSSSYTDQISAKSYSKSPSLGSTSPGMSSNSYSNNIPHSTILQHSAHNGSSQHLSSLSPRSYKEEVSSQQQYLAGSIHSDRHGSYNHGSMSQNPGESMTLPKFKHKYLAHNQHIPRRHIGTFKFFIIGKTERPSILNKGTQTSEESMGELKIKIPKAELYKRESDNEFSDGDGGGRRHPSMQNAANRGTSRGSPRITFPYDPLPSHGGEYRDYNKNSKIKTVISPSFLDSAGKATMTTCVSNKATIVTVGIVSRPAGLGGAEPTGSIYQKGIMATGISDHNVKASYKHPNSRPPYKHHNSRNSEGNLDSSGEQNIENYEQVMEERKAKARDLEQERMEVSVRIDDTQYIQVGNAKRWQCNECDKSYTTKHNLVMHVLDHSGIKPHLCLKCGKYFKQLSHLNTHMLTHDKIKPHTCNLCGKGFTQISHLKRHAAVSEKNGYCANLRSKHPLGHSPSSSQLGSSGPAHAASKRYPNQNQVFDSAENYDMEDTKDLDKNGAGGRLLCRYCDRRFRYPSQLKDHMQSHNGQRPYMCTECGMDFMKEHHLKAHQFTHTGLKPYTCDACGRSFNQRANLQRHKLIHDTTRTFKCHVCGKMFTQPQTLKAHQVVHADRKPFECSICGKEFGRYHNLQGHMHMHTNSKPYVCFCGSTFTLKGNLNRHKKVKHGLNETTDVMEEDAVNFLSSLSERARDEHNVEGEAESLSPGSGAEGGDGKSGRKGRKSIPRKITLAEGEETSFPQQPTLQVTTSVQEATSNMQPVVALKPFVIQNPDTDDEEVDDEEEEGEIPNPPAVPNSMKLPHENTVPVASVMKLPHENTAPVASMINLSHENTAPVASMIKLPHENTAPVASMIKLPHENTAPVASVMKLPHENTAPVASMMNFQPLNISASNEVVNPTKPVKRPRLDEQTDSEKRPRRQSQRRSPIVHTSEVEESDTGDENADNDNTDTDWIPGSRRRSRGKSDTGEKKI